MMRRVILIRHAKSSWADPFADDHARVLNARGRAAAAAVGKWLSGQSYCPETILCSDAARTLQTAELIMQELDSLADLKLTGQLYHAAPDTICDLLAQQTTASCAIIGHNPGIGLLAGVLARQAPDHPRFDDYPTCATTVLDFDGPIRAKTGYCTAFVVPHDIDDDLESMRPET